MEKKHSLSIEVSWIDLHELAVAVMRYDCLPSFVGHLMNDNGIANAKPKVARFE